MRAIGVLGVALVSGTMHAHPQSTPHQAVPFRLEQPGQVLVPVTVDGQGPFPFLLDTGASHSAVSVQLGERLGARPVGQTAVTSAVGHEVRPVVVLRRVELGPIVANGVLASVISSRFEPAALGVIGQDLLSARPYTLDYASRQIVWPVRIDDVRRRGSAFHMQCDFGRCLVDLPQRAFILRLVPDSGADGLVLYERSGGPRLPLRVRPGLTAVTSPAGQRMARPVWMSELRLASTRLFDVPAALLRTEDGDSPPGDGLLPLHTFERVTFDIQHGLLIIENLISGTD